MSKNKTKIVSPTGKDLLRQENPPQIASRANVGWDLNLFFNALPDPDIILKRLGKSYTALREVESDDQFETAWTSRISAVTKPDWFIEDQDNTTQSKKATEFINDIFSSYSMEDLVPQLLEYSLYGFVVAEIIWDNTSGYWIPTDIIPKPQEWFAFDKDNNLVLRTRLNTFKELPPNKFILIRNRPSYVNPYGKKLLSKIYWPYIFRKNGAQWWATFTEKFGAAFATAKYRPGAPDNEIDDIINMLENLVACGVAAFPEGTDIEILTDTSKGAATSNFSQFQAFFNESISKVILGGTLTTDIGDVGSKSAATVHNGVREDIALADRKKISDAFNSLIALTVKINFGENVTPPIFKWEQKEDLNTEKLDRDTKLYNLGWRPTNDYISETYTIPKDKFNMVSTDSIFSENEASSKFSNIQAVKDLETQENFNQEMFSVGQIVINQLIDDYNNAIQKAETYEEAQEILIRKYKKHTKLRENFASVLDNVRFLASQIGADSAKGR